MNWKPLVILAALALAVTQLKDCRYGAEHQDVDPKYEKAHLTAVSAQRLLEEKKYAEALAYYEAARAEMEHPAVRADHGQDNYINYGFVLNEIGAIHTARGLYGDDLDTRGPIDPEAVDTARLQTARRHLEDAIAFYHRWFEHNPKEYERFAKAVSQSYYNLGVADKYLGEAAAAADRFIAALLYNPDNGDAERALELLEIDPQPHIEAGRKQWDENKSRRLL